ncbi:hypothetical protein NRB_31960 [Novosphingobium sp. 11B]
MPPVLVADRQVRQAHDLQQRARIAEQPRFLGAVEHGGAQRLEHLGAVVEDRVDQRFLGAEVVLDGGIVALPCRRRDLAQGDAVDPAIGEELLGGLDDLDPRRGGSDVAATAAFGSGPTVIGVGSDSVVHGITLLSRVPGFGKPPKGRPVDHDHLTAPGASPRSAASYLSGGSGPQFSRESMS